MADRVQYIYPGRDNEIRLQLLQDGAAIDSSGITRMTFEVAGQTFDSSVDASVVSWDSVGNVTIDIGPDLSADWTGYGALVVFDAGNPNGIVWISCNLERGQNRIKVVIRDECA